MPDQVKVEVLVGNKLVSLTDRDIKPSINWPDVARVEVSLEGIDRRFVFYTLPTGLESYIRHVGGEVRVRAPVPWFFGKTFTAPHDQNFFLEVIIKNGKITTFTLGGHKEGNLLVALKNRKTFKILDSPFAASFTKLPTEIAEDPDIDPDSALRCAFSSIRRPDLKGHCMPSQHWTPIFEQRVRLEADQLKAFGAQERVPEGPVRLVQIPGAMVCGEEGSLATEQTWYIGILGLPFVWGRAIWNSLLAEQIRVSNLDIQHGSLFAPLFSLKGNSGLLWNLIYEVRRFPKRWDQIPLARSLELVAVDEKLAAQADFSLLRNHLGQSIQARLPLPLSPIPPSKVELATWEEADILVKDLLETVKSPGLSLRLRKDETVAATSQNRSVRIGSLDFTFASQPRKRDRADVPFFRWDLVRSERGKITQETEPGFDYKYEWSEAQIDLDWAIESISPGGQDDLSGEFYANCDSSLQIPASQKEEHDLECTQRRERPLVVPLPKATANGLTGVVLNVQERARQGDLRRIDLVLRRTDGAGGPGDELKELAVCSPENEPKLDRVAVLDREPFLVAKVSFPSLGSLQDPASGNEIANWQSYGSDAGAWHIRFPNAQNFCLTLPSQGVGETMEKRIKDDQGLPEGTLADFRLSPPAFLAMRERYYRQNFPEAPWNLRRLLSDPERELPGAHLEHLQYELLYGLSCRIDYPFMRLAEVSALVGDVMGPLPQRPAWVPLKKEAGKPTVAEKNASDRYFEARQRWIDFAKRTRQRLGIFELWDIRKLDTLELKENVTCWIRHVDPQKVPVELVKVRPSDTANPFDPQEVADKGKLRGGATWGFESRNVYGAVVRDGPNKKWPQSSGAEMKETRLSALGGWGHQTTAFDNWRTKILADVAMGRTYSYTLERIGRIGVWWNRAKHVIVYERTVVPSRLFGTLKPEEPDAQNPHEGRAVLRKVDEYIEILQNTRKYPDQGKGDAKATGCINECCFSEDPNQVVRFRVRGSWGTDVGKEGWKIPIWRPGELPGDLFPKPKVHLTVMASVDGKSEPRKVTIADPENLFFYTDTTVPPEALDNPSIDLSNTDAWVPVEGVDFVDQSRPRPAPDPAFASGSLRQSSPGDTVIPVGFRPCTFQIEPAEHTVDLLANRKGDPMGSLLSSVTMCRADLSDEVSAFSNVIVTAKSEVSKFIEKGIAALPADPRRFNPTDINTVFNQLCTTVSEEVNKALSGPRAQLDEASKQIKNGTDLVTALHEQAIESITQGTQRLLRFPEDFVRNFETEKDKLPEALELEIEKLLGQVALLPSLTAYLSNAENALHSIQLQLDATTKELSAIVSHDVSYWVEDTKLSRLPELVQLLQSYRSQLRAIVRKIQELTAAGPSILSGDKTVTASIGPQWVHVKLDLEKVKENLEKVEAMLTAAQNLAAAAEQQREHFKSLVKERLADLQSQADVFKDKTKEVQRLLKIVRDEIKEAEKERRAQVKAFASEVSKKAIAAIGPLDRPGQLEVAIMKAAWERALTSQAAELKKGLEGVLAAVQGRTQEFTEGLDKVEKIIPSPDRVQEVVGEQCSALQRGVKNLLKDIDGKLDLEAQAAEVRRLLERYRDDAVQDLDARLGGGIKAARQVLGVVESKKDDVLKLVRAFGKPPDVSGLEFDRPEVAFFYNELKDRIDVTPVIARAAQAAAIVEALKPFGVDLPVKELGEQLIPAELRNFDLSSILPNIAGIPLKDLFSGLKMPAGSSDAVKVRHGLDPQTRRAWVNTEINFQSSENATLFAVGPLAVRVNQPHFQAEARMEADLQKIRKKKVSGELRGDWLLQIGGFPLITFKQTPLTFDEAGRINFQVNPKDVVLAPALDFINNLMTTISPGGLTTRFDGDGVVSTLDLPIPDTQIGAFGFSGLRLCASMALRYGSGEFNIGVTAGLARRDAPFTLTIFILGGAGYLELGSRYVPSTGKVYATADMAIAVSASLAIALGPIRGGVAVYIGVTANYDSQRGGGLVVGLMFMVRGHVSVLSIASATITLRLDGQYQNGAMVGRGHLEIKIKICWCFTLEVSESVTYTLGRPGSGSQRGWLGGPQPVAQLASFQGASPASGSGSKEDFQIDPKLLVKAVNEYLNMLE